jgi:hypothetical protein
VPLGGHQEAESRRTLNDGKELHRSCHCPWPPQVARVSDHPEEFVTDCPREIPGAISLPPASYK